MTLVEDLKKFEIKAHQYARGPLGKDPFVASIRPFEKCGKIYIWPGKAEIDLIDGSKIHRQAVLNVEESKRIVSTHRVQYLTRMAAAKWDNLTDSHYSDIAITRPIVNGIDSRLWKVKNIIPDRPGGYYRIAFEAVVPAATHNLLMGMDETYHFIGALPQKVSSVEEAHEILRPIDSDKFERQGEWFFYPIEDEKLLASLDKLKPLNMALESGSSHQACVVSFNRRQYARGYVSDTRGTHHEPLFLHDWHQVVRNREIVFAKKTQMAQRSRYWD